MSHCSPRVARLTTLARAALLSLGAQAVLWAPAGAQTSTAAAARPADTGEIETVTVTANRRIEDQQKVSTSVTALSGAMLSERNIYDITQFEGLSPGFTFGRTGNDARPAMRGVRTEAIQLNADPTIGFFVDGVYKSRTSQALASFVDLERVEVQRGPQGTLFGRNTFGGNIVLTTAKPELGDTSATGSVLLGSFNRLRLEAAGTVPLASTVAVRVAAAYDKSDGYVKNDFNKDADLFDNDLRYLRGTVRFKPDNRFDASIKVEHTTQGGNGAGVFSYFQRGTYLNGTCRPLLNATFYPLNGRAGLTDGVADCARTQGIPGGAAVGSTADVGRPVYSPGNVWRIDTDFQSTQDLTDTSVTADVAWRTDAFTLKSITGWTDFSVLRAVDQDFSRDPIVVSYERTKDKAVSQELQILSEGTGPFGFVAGLYFFKDRVDNLGVVQFLSRTVGNGTIDSARADTTSRAAYGQLSFKATDALTLTGGLRYTEDRKKYRFANRNGYYPVPAGTAVDPVWADYDELNAPDAVYGSAGVTNCGPAVGGFPAGVTAPGANCGGVGNNTFFGATYSPVTFKKTTGRAAAEYQLNNDQLLYLSYSTGFSSGGFNGSQTALITEATRSFNPQEVTAIELGSKNRFLNRTLQLNVALFNNRYQDQQEQRQVQVGPTTASLLFNAARSKANGLEVEGEWRVTRDFRLGAVLSLLDAKYTQFADAPGPIAITQLISSPGTPAVVENGVTTAPAGQTRVFSPGYNCRLVPGTGVGTVPQAYGCNLTGNKIPYAAERSASLSASYEFGLGSLGTLTPQIVATYNSGYFLQIYNTDAERQGAYTKGDFKILWRATDAITVQGFVDNFNDKQVVNRATWGGGSTLQASAAAPRTFGLKASYSFF